MSPVLYLRYSSGKWEIKEVVLKLSRVLTSLNNLNGSGCSRERETKLHSFPTLNFSQNLYWSVLFTAFLSVKFFLPSQ